MASQTVKHFLRGRPTTEREDARYVADMVQALAWVTPEEHSWLTDPRNGIATKCRFLPTPADVFEFIREKQAKVDQFKPGWSPSSGPIIKASEYDPRPEASLRKAQVRALLGYDPIVGRDAKVKRDLAPATDDDLDELKRRTKDSPHHGKPMTREFQELAIQQGLMESE